MQIMFTKMHALGNDFILIDLDSAGLASDWQPSAATIQSMAHRHTGIGCDQVLLLSAMPSDPQYSSPRYRYQIYNADGNAVSQCGNGARCAARYVFDRHGHEEAILITRDHQNMRAQLDTSHPGWIQIELGTPNFTAEAIPLHAQGDISSLHAEGQYQLTWQGYPLPFTALTVGNPHAVFFAQDLAQAPVAELGTYLNQHPSFPTGVNVGFMVVNNDTQISLRVYERGVGETSACGSGAAAAMIAGIIQNRLRTQEPITIHMPGGQLSASWQGKEHSVILCGLADYAFTGEYTLTSA